MKEGKTKDKEREDTMNEAQVKESQAKEPVIIENKMGVMPVNKLLLSMSLPMMLSMLVQALYNIVDSIFVARICEDALTAVSLAFPIQSFMIAMSAGMCVGVNALLSRALGEGEKEKANLCAKNGMFLALMNYIVFVIIGIFVVKPFYYGQTNNTDIIGYGIDYLSIVCVASFGLSAQFIFERLLQSTGKTVYTMVTQLIGAIINLILDPIFIFGWFGMPELGVKGAALATVIGQIAAGIAACIINIKKNGEIDINLKGFKPSGNIIKRIYSVGIPSIIMQSIGSIMVFGMNKILMGFNSTAAAVFGIYFKLQSFVFMPIFGLNNGMVPIVAYNYGAQKIDRLVKTVKLSAVYAVSIMLIGLSIFHLIPDKLLLMFDASELMLEMGQPALRIISLHFVLAGFCIIGGSMFQALGNAIFSMITAICRQLVILLPAAYLLSLTGKVDNVWWAFPIAELMAVTMTAIFMVITYKKYLK